LKYYMWLPSIMCVSLSIYYFSIGIATVNAPFLVIGVIYILNAFFLPNILSDKSKIKMKCPSKLEDCDFKTHIDYAYFWVTIHNIPILPKFWKEKQKIFKCHHASYMLIDGEWWQYIRRKHKRIPIEEGAIAKCPKKCHNDSQFDASLLYVHRGKDGRYYCYGCNWNGDKKPPMLYCPACNSYICREMKDYKLTNIKGKSMCEHCGTVFKKDGTIISKMW